MLKDKLEEVNIVNTWICRSCHVLFEFKPSWHEYLKHIYLTHLTGNEYSEFYKYLKINCKDNVFNKTFLDYIFGISDNHWLLIFAKDDEKLYKGLQNIKTLEFRDMYKGSLTIIVNGFYRVTNDLLEDIKKC